MSQQYFQEREAYQQRNLNFHCSIAIYQFTGFSIKCLFRKSLFNPKTSTIKMNINQMMYLSARIR